MKTTGYVLLAVLFLSAMPYAAEAASIRIQPHQFKPVDPSNLHNYQEPAHIYGDGGIAEYYAVVNLPVGKTITRLTFHHRSTGLLESYAELTRTRFGQLDQRVAEIPGGGDTADNVVAISTTDIERPLVKAGFTYYLYVFPGPGNYIHGVKINYE